MGNVASRSQKPLIFATFEIKFNTFLKTGVYLSKKIKTFMIYSLLIRLVHVLGLLLEKVDAPDIIPDFW